MRYMSRAPRSGRLTYSPERNPVAPDGSGGLNGLSGGWNPVGLLARLDCCRCLLPSIVERLNRCMLNRRATGSARHRVSLEAASRLKKAL